jgi:pyruvate kinase
MLNDSSHVRATKIIATLGPATDSLELLCDIINAGADVLRINFSHSVEPTEVAETVRMVREASVLCDKQVAILGDLCGPKMRLRGVPEGGVHVEVGAMFALVPIGTAAPDLDMASFLVSIPSLCEDILRGDRVLVADGTIAGTARNVYPTHVEVVCTTGGLVLDRKGVNLPDTALTGAALTMKDRADVANGVALGFDIFALSFVRTAEDIGELRALLPAGTPVVAKIERPEALEVFPFVCGASDAIMVARGDLGVEVGWETVPGLQMDMIETASEMGVLSIVATEMLESMTHAQRPTRAEVADVASAVMDGASAVMVSAETAMGADPARVVSVLNDILVEIEGHTRYRERNRRQTLKHKTQPGALAAAATRLARDIGAGVVAVESDSGETVRLVSAARPYEQIVALCRTAQVARTLALWWGVHALVLKPGFTDTELLQGVASQCGEGHGGVVFVSGSPGAPSADQIRILPMT